MKHDPVDVAQPWTIKSVPTATREAVIKAARQEGITVGQWLEKRVNEWLADGSPVHVAPPGASLDNMAALKAAAEAMALVAEHSGKPIPSRNAASFYALIGGAVREARRVSLPRAETGADLSRSARLPKAETEADRQAAERSSLR